MIETQKLKIKRQSIENLPVFYDFIIYNELVNSTELGMDKHMFYNDKISAFIPFSGSKKLISKIVDYSSLKIALPDEQPANK